MAEENEGASKTEEATPRKLEDARKKGDVPKSQDVAPFAALAAAVAVLAVFGERLSGDLATSLARFVTSAGAFELSGGGAVEIMRASMLMALPLFGAVMLATALAGAAGNLLQHGVLWSPDKLKPELKKVSPLEGFKRLFGPDALFNFAKTFIKLVAVCVVVWFAVKSRLASLQGLSALDVAAMMPLTREIVIVVTTGVLLLLLVLAGGDFLFQRMRFAQRMRMTKEELKDDYKQSEGDPHIKGKLKQQRIERSKRRMMQNLPRATVVVMNPTHYAVALRYEPGETAAPVCLAKGTDALALRIRAMAEELGVPVVEDPPLARALHAAVDVDETIPREHFEAVAKVIGFVLGGRQRERASPLRP
jgi:flagellar biosynthetic protein FlhB